MTGFEPRISGIVSNRSTNWATQPLPKLKLKKVRCLMKFEPAKRVKAKAKQNYTLELLIDLEMVYSCCLSLWGNLYVLDFHQKNFYNISCWTK